MATPELHGSAAADDSQAHFVTLPNELICVIASPLGFPDLLKLRLVLPKSHQASVLKLLKHTMKRLYLEPTAKSLDVFGKICASQFFQNHVEEVVFVARKVDKKSNLQDSMRDIRRKWPSASKRE